jgi:lipopolysaccharide export LptBFGC system permease protein LptF
MTTNEITQSARRKVLETTDEIVSNDVILLYANQAYIEVYKRVFTSNEVKTVDVSCTNGVCTLPTRYGRMYAKAVDQDGNEFEEVSIADFHQNEQHYVYTIDNGQLLISSDDVTTLTTRYFEQPETLTTTVNPSIDDYFHEVIVYGTIWRIHEDLQDEELATYYQTKFEEELTRRIAAQSSYEETNQRGGEMFGYQRLI